MAEWILQYESVCRRQELYLQQIKELRQQLRARTGDRPHKATIKHIDSKNAATVNNCHWGPSRLPLFKSDSKSPHQVCVLHPRRKHQLNNSHKDFWQPRDFSLQQQGVATDFLMAPRSLNRADISRRHARQPVKAPVRLPPIEELDRNKTDYEPIEFIAKRNKLNLGKYLREGQTWSRITPRETIDMSDVYVQSTKII